MKSKGVTQEKVDQLKAALSELPTQKKIVVGQDEALRLLSKNIRDLYLNKNYEIREIVTVLKENGLTVTQREVKKILGEKYVKSTKK